MRHIGAGRVNTYIFRLSTGIDGIAEVGHFPAMRDNDSDSHEPERVPVRLRNRHGREVIVSGVILAGSGNVIVTRGSMVQARKGFGCRVPRCTCNDSIEPIGGEWIQPHPANGDRRIRPLFMWSVDFIGSRHTHTGSGLSLGECLIRARAFVANLEPDSSPPGFLHVLETDRRSTGSGEIPPARLIYQLHYQSHDRTARLFPNRTPNPAIDSETLHVQQSDSSPDDIERIPGEPFGPDSFGGEDYPALPFSFDTDA